jgi:outer membrane protein OmpU
MNNIKKVGLTALAGSLVMVSANAVEYTMSGGLLTVFSTASQDSSNTVSGRGLGTATDLSFNASGELDNGFTVDYFMSVDTHKALSNTSSFMTVGMGSLGTIRVNNDSGSVANSIDDITPNAYNETWDGLTSVTNPSFFGNQTTEGSLDYRIAPQEYSGMTVNASITYDPDYGQAAPLKGGVTNTVAAGGSGQAYTLQLAHESGISVGAGHEILNGNAGNANHQDETRSTGYVKYAMGGLTAAYQEAYQDSAAGAALEGQDLESAFIGVAYTMGDITVSYAESEYDKRAVSDTAALITEEMSSIQIAYTMGAMTVSAAMSETDNVAGITAIGYEENTLAVSFAF